jgi:hypothetical protein
MYAWVPHRYNSLSIYVNCLSTPDLSPYAPCSNLTRPFGHLNTLHSSRENSVGTAMDYVLEGRGSIPGKGKKCLPIPEAALSKAWTVCTH